MKESRPVESNRKGDWSNSRYGRSSKFSDRCSSFGMLSGCTVFSDTVVACPILNKNNAVMQNKRCSSVFKDPDRFNGQAYDINAIVWEDEEGFRFTNSESEQPIEFPYWPKTEYRKAQ